MHSTIPSTAHPATLLDRRAVGGARPAPGMIHVGLGAFHRAHQAWYTELVNRRADQAHDPVGIVAFTGRRATAATLLAAQDGVYTLLERGADGDLAELVGAIVGAHPADDTEAWQAAWSDPAITVVTLTVTEAGYAAGGVADRLAAGLRTRAHAGAGPIALVPCDNLAGNGERLRHAIEQADPEVGSWLGQRFSIVSTMVDRITPATTDADRQLAAKLTGLVDRCPVVTEPYREWVLAGEFPAGRPAWEKVGARMVDDITVHEHRKLWLLNGAHSTLAYLGLKAGYSTVAEAFADADLRLAVEQIWDEAATCLPLPATELASYRADLAARFANPRIAHQLRQIAMDGSFKLAERIIPVVAARAERGEGFAPIHLAVIRSWIELYRRGLADDQPRAEVLRGPDPIAAAVSLIGASLPTALQADLRRALYREL